MKKVNNTIQNCSIISLTTRNQSRKFISVEKGRNVPFEIKRIYYLYDIPKGEERGGHAHIELYQLIVAVSGSFEVILDDGFNKKKILLNTSKKGLLVVPGIWRELTNFISNSICLVFASQVFQEEDYIRSYDTFKKWKN